MKGAIDAAGLFGADKEAWDVYTEQCLKVLINDPEMTLPLTEAEGQLVDVLAVFREKHPLVPEASPVIVRFERGAMLLIVWNNGPHFKGGSLDLVGSCCRYFGSAYVHEDGVPEPIDLYACRNARIVFCVARGKVQPEHVHIDAMMQAIGSMVGPQDFNLKYKDLLAAAVLASRAFGN